MSKFEGVFPQDSLYRLRWSNGQCKTSWNLILTSGCFLSQKNGECPEVFWKFAGFRDKMWNAHITYTAPNFSSWPLKIMAGRLDAFLLGWQFLGGCVKLQGPRKNWYGTLKCTSGNWVSFLDTWYKHFFVFMFVFLCNLIGIYRCIYIHMFI